MFKKKKKSPSAKDISALSQKENAPAFTSQSYSSLPKSMYSGNEKQGTPKRSVSGSKTLNLSNSSSSQEFRPTSPLDLPFETLQSISAAYNLGKGYGSEMSPGSKPSGAQNRSPYQSPVHSSSISSMKNSTRHRSLEKGEMSGMFSGDSTLEQQFERLQMMMPRDTETSHSSTMPISRDRRGGSSMNYTRERSQEREQYPHMGARSLERDHYFHVGNRSRSNDRQDYTSQLAQTQEQFRNLSRDSLILELQSQITDLNKDCAKFQQELDSTKDKLSSTMNSIKTFWSPELKKERALRKEESAKYSLLNEQFKVTQAELKKQASSVRELESKVRSHKQSAISSPVPKEEHDTLKREYDDQTKETRILRKTVDEMELRLETQKQTLAARDGSIKKLLEMLQSKGLAADKIEESQKELEKVRVGKIEDQKTIKELRDSVSVKERNIVDLKECNSKLTEKLHDAEVQLKQQPASTHTMQAILEAKDSRIAALEKELQSLEERLHRFGEEGTADKDGSLKEILPSREKALKAEIESCKTELTNKDNEITGLKMRAETLHNQQSEHQHYINVLKDQIAAKEQQSSMFQADIEDLRERLKEKDAVIDRKSQNSQTLTVEKRKLELEILELRDGVDIKERKINVLQRKIENLEDLVSEKDDQLKAHLTCNSTESTDSAISSMEESIFEKDKQIERLKEQREIMELEHQEECDHLMKSNQDLKSQLDLLQLDITDKQTELCELREEVSELKSSRFKADTRLRQLDLSIAEKDAEVSRISSELNELKSTPKPDTVTEEQIGDLRNQVEQCQTELKTAQTEVDRLLEILKETENEKHDKDNQIKELQETLKEYKQKFGTLKRIQQTDRKKSAHLLEEARRREEDISTDSMQLKGSMKEKEGRIEELEEALRESVKITAEREMLLMEQKMQIDACNNEIEELKAELLKSQSSSREYGSKLTTYVKQLEEKDNKLKKLHSERHKHLEEVFEMKQEALQAAICEKDANIALLEMTSTKKQRNTEEIEKLSKEKEKMAQQLKELTQNRTRYLQERSKARSKSSGRKSKSAEREVKAENGSKNDTHTDSKADSQSDSKDHEDDSVISADPTC